MQIYVQYSAIPRMDGMVSKETKGSRNGGYEVKKKSPLLGYPKDGPA